MMDRCTCGLSVTLCILLYANVASAYVFRKVPTRYTLLGEVSETLNDVDLNGCINALNGNDEVLAIKYTFANTTCYAYSALQSYHPVVPSNTSNQTVWYMRDDTDCSGCLTSKRTQQLLAMYTYPNNTCVPKYGFEYETVYGYCSASCKNQNSGRYGNQVACYRIGATADQTCYIMTRPQMLESANYACDVGSFPVVYNNVYYCYIYVKVNDTSVTPFKDNWCTDYLTDGYGLQLIHDLIYGEAQLMSSGQSYAGAYFNGTKYVYTDGTELPSNVQWTDGYPTNKTFVFIVTDTLKLTDSSSFSGGLTCMSKAQKA